LYSYLQPGVTLPENIVLKVTISKFVSAGNLYFPPKGERGIFPFNLITGKRNTFLWFFSAIGITNPVPFGIIYSGKRDLDYTTHVDLLIKLKRKHLIEIETAKEEIELSPDSIYSVPIKLKNLGSHKDTFNFNVDVSATDGLEVSPLQSVTLESNEEKEVSLGIATSEKFWDPGTLHSITIEAYSLYDSDNTFSKTIPIVTKGVHVSEYSRYGVDARIQVSVDQSQIPDYCSAYLFKQASSVKVTTDFMSAEKFSMGVRFLKEAPQQKTVNIPVVVKVSPTQAFPYSTVSETCSCSS